MMGQHMKQLQILVVDDETSIQEMLCDGLRSSGYEVAAVGGGSAALHLMKQRAFDVVLLDIHLRGMDGIAVLETLRADDPELDVVVMTGNPEMETAIQALRLGAYDYLIKPLNWENLRHLMKRIAERRSLRNEVRSLRERLSEKPAAAQLIGDSAPMQRVKEVLRKVASSDSVVLIEGESGTGKELYAGTIHQLSQRREGPFIPVNCGAIPDELMESEFFGHVKGAFSGAFRDVRGLFRSAQGGTLFLDEIVELPLHLQPKLLRVLQEKEVRPIGSAVSINTDVRIVAATNQDIEKAVEEGRFRQDLFFRLNVVRIEAPPLRRTKEDIPALIAHFFVRFNQSFGRSIEGISEKALAALMNYDFPGNVRELENLIERAYALGASSIVDIDDLPTLQSPLSPKPGTLQHAELQTIRETLDRCNGDKGLAAQALGMSARTLYRRIKELGL